MNRLKHNLEGLLGALSLLAVWDVAYWFLPNKLAWLTALIGLPLTLFAPGLFLIVMLGARRLTAVTSVFAVGLSVLLLILAGLAANFVPQWFGVHRPLDTWAIPISFCVMYTGLAIGAATQYVRPRNTRQSNDHARPIVNWLIRAIAFLAPFLAALGAFMLNNHGPNTIALVALGVTVGLVPLVYSLRHRLSTATFIWTLAGASLALLVSISLRGWYISGQDMQHEFQVFSLASQLGRWDINFYHDSYNACLSVTLLPIMLSHVLHIDGAVVFKLILQLIFVAVPATIFITTRQLLGRDKAFLAAALFIGLPTFSIDVPFITRQEIAYLFAALAIAAIFINSERWLRRHRNALVVSLSLGVVVSHYSTAYLFIGSLVLAYGLTKLYELMAKRLKRPRRNHSPATISIWSIIVIAVGAYIWLGQVTRASSDLGHKLAGATSSISQLAGDPGLLVRSLQSSSLNSTETALTKYVARSNVDPQANVSELRAGLKTVSSDDPPSKLTAWVKHRTGINLAALVPLLYYGLATKLYLAFGLGMVMLMFVRSAQRQLKIPILYTSWSIASLIVLVAQLMLPALAENYGITRAFMQAFLILNVPMLVGLYTLPQRWSRLNHIVAAVIVSALLILYSGFLPYLSGGLHRQLSLQNAGQYYGTVYPQADDLAAYHWIQTNLPPGAKVNIADYAAMYAYYPLSTLDTTSPNLFPFQIKSGDYVMLSSSQTVDHVVYTFDDLIGLSINPSMYSSADLVYTSGNVRIYRKN